MQLLVSQEPINESASSDDMERAGGPIHVLNVPFGSYDHDGEEGDVMSEAEDDNDSEGQRG